MGVDYFTLPLVPSPQGRGKLKNRTLIRGEAISVPAKSVKQFQKGFTGLTGFS
jgi:hypothetical protein